MFDVITKLVINIHNSFCYFDAGTFSDFSHSCPQRTFIADSFESSQLLVNPLNIIMKLLWNTIRVDTKKYSPGAY